MLIPITTCVIRGKSPPVCVNKLVIFGITMVIIKNKTKNKIPKTTAGYVSAPLTLVNVWAFFSVCLAKSRKMLFK